MYIVGHVAKVVDALSFCLDAKEQKSEITRTAPPVCQRHPTSLLTTKDYILLEQVR